MSSNEYPAIVFPGEIIISYGMSAVKYSRRDDTVRPEHVVLWADASQRPATGEAGMAVAWKPANDKHWREVTEREKGPITNDRAELRALVMAAEQAEKLIDGQQDVTHVRIYTDSMTALKRVGDWLPGDGEWGEEEVKRLNQLVREIQEGQVFKEARVKVTLRWIKGHAHEKLPIEPVMGSCWADFWASLAVDKGANMAKRAKREAMSNMRYDVTIQIWEMVKDRHMADEMDRLMAELQ